MKVLNKFRGEGGKLYATVENNDGSISTKLLRTEPVEPVELVTPEPVRECEGQGRDGFDIADDAEGGGVVLTVAVLAGLFIVLVIALAFFV